MVTLDGRLLEIRVGVQVVFGKVQAIEFVGFAGSDADDGAKQEEDQAGGGDGQGGDDGQGDGQRGEPAGAWAQVPRARMATAIGAPNTAEAVDGDPGGGVVDFPDHVQLDDGIRDDDAGDRAGEDGAGGDEKMAPAVMETRPPIIPA